MIPHLPGFQYGSGPTNLEPVWPVAEMIPASQGVGGTSDTAAGISVSYLVGERTDELLNLTLRLTESEWVAFDAFRKAARPPSTFLFYWQDAPGTTWECYLVSPRIEDRSVSPRRDPRAPWIFLVDIVIREVNDTPWNLPFYP